MYTTEQIKQKVAPIAQRYGLAAVYLFGSHARGSATEQSDIDIMIDRAGSSVKGLQFCAVCLELQDALAGAKVDVITLQQLLDPPPRQPKAFRDCVMKDKVKIYDRKRPAGVPAHGTVL
jgi:predicted nucleotidyltransferase